MERGWLYDGATAVRHEVEIASAGETLIVHYADGGTSEVPKDRLFHVDTRGDWEVYGHVRVDGWRLGVPKQAAAALGAALPGRRRYGRWIDRVGLGRALVAAAVTSAAVVFVATRLPGWIAPLVPMSLEEKVGRPVVASLEGSFCNGPGGQDALRKLVRALSPRADELDIRVVNFDIVNAAALPGGHIVLFEELVSRAEGPEEVAGVLAHEIAHIENRHVTEAMIRQLTFGLFVSLFGGGTGATLETFLGARYTRGAEAEADEDAIRALQRAGISPLGAAAFFARLARDERSLGAFGQGLSYISTHPAPGERERRFRESAAGRSEWKPPLSRDEWEALADICHNDPEQNPS